MRRATLSNNSFARLAAVACCTVCAPAPGAPSNAAENVSVWQGVYTKEQAARGKARYFSSCAVCHGGLLQGDSDSPELAGPAFMKRWGDQSVGALFAFAMSQMPVGRPGSLGAQGYADVIAHILATNGFPDGQRELPANGSVLDGIIIEKK
jgi:S-disulfanyl-L-cysteine oxidoreductase SoxD